MILGGGRRFEAGDLLTPVDCNSVVGSFEKHRFETCAAETFKPDLHFANFDDFMSPTPSLSG
jgi:hypothetical protein